MGLSGTPQKALSARSLGLVACTRCTRAWPLDKEHCGRCGHALVSRDEKGMQRVWAFWVMGIIFYIPANLFPMLRTRTLFTEQEDTIIGGAVELARHGAWVVATIILVASVVIPLAKFCAIAYLAISVQQRSAASYRQRQFLYEVVEYIGRWSMIDIFVVAILSSLVQLKALASVNPGPASLFFALSVIFTMLSAQSFDSRTIWDVQSHDKEPRDDV